MSTQETPEPSELSVFFRNVATQLLSLQIQMIQIYHDDITFLDPGIPN